MKIKTYPFCDAVVADDDDNDDITDGVGDPLFSSSAQFSLVTICSNICIFNIISL